eukprot:COSAG03_NODE_3887_length_1779_cov_4.489881_2_plen_76_part_00
MVDWRWDPAEGGKSWWLIDRPFDVLVETENVLIEITTFRGNNIFENNDYSDCGVFQFYGPSHCTFASPTHFFIQT